MCSNNILNTKYVSHKVGSGTIITQYRDQTSFSMHQHQLKGEGFNEGDYNSVQKRECFVRFDNACSIKQHTPF